jgi:hypothetical protein
LTNGCAWNAVSAFANCGRAVAHVRGSYVPILLQKSKIEQPKKSRESRFQGFFAAASLFKATTEVRDRF